MKNTIISSTLTILGIAAILLLVLSRITEYTYKPIDISNYTLVDKGIGWTYKAFEKYQDSTDNIITVDVLGGYYEGNDYLEITKVTNYIIFGKTYDSKYFKLKYNKLDSLKISYINERLIKSFK